MVEQRRGSVIGRMLVIAVGAAALTGCYGKQLVREPITIAETADDVQALREQQLQLSQNLRALEEQIAKQTDLLRQLKADNQSRSDDLESRFLSVDSKLQDLLSRRGSSSGGSSSAPSWSSTPPSIPAAFDTSRAGPGATGRDAAGTDPSRSMTVAPGDSPEAEAKRIYDQAYLDNSKSNYSLSVIGFREYLRRVPEGDLSDNAQYWIAEAFYAQRDFGQAVQEFMKVLQTYPKGDKVPGALLKIGYSHLQQGDKNAARRYLNQVIDEYPNSDESTLAKSKLRQLQ
ncbi:MAG: tol-pal system protein YbgF [Candidatus Eisenbacteria bacterium]|nr:tol-pal system protein YbgF [Candidatus Eisenbacteria bacterium]MCC7143344.1 tol-pal system protein YbgF [Candidatus Eisenbacteria bacterium]